MEHIICAAIRYDEQIWYGHRHHHALEAMKDRLSYEMNRKQMQDKHVGEDQGFVTSERRYVGREEAYKIAIKARQVLPEDGKILLYSEDLY